MSAADASETLRALCGQGFASASSPENADAILLTTCTVRAHAEQRALSLIGRLRTWRNASPRRFLAVAGCLAQRQGAALKRRFPHVDAVIGARDADKYADIFRARLQATLEGDITRARLQETLEGYRKPGTDVRPQIGHTDAKAGARLQATEDCHPKPGTGVTQTVTVMRGCDCGCSYCIVPSVRGPEICRDPDDILAEAKAKVEGGAKELTLLGQRVNAYAWGEMRFAGLLRKIDAIPGLLRLRFMSPHPALVSDDLVNAIRDCRRAAPFIHLPAQSGCDRLLALMRRGYTRADLLRSADRLRAAIPDVVLSTDIIVGFSTETNEEFAESLSMLAELRPATTFAFKYSIRPGTPSAALPDDVPLEAKEERLATLNSLVERLTTEALQRQIGNTVEVLAETPQFGRTATGFKVRWGEPAQPGSLTRVIVRGATRRTLLGDRHEP
jgi:tRNA-2-methylthio-N6-dimethylallyladenosine synthase